MLVNQSFHSVPHSFALVTQPTTPMPISIIAAKVHTRIGSWYGIASQVSRPKISLARSSCSELRDSDMLAPAVRAPRMRATTNCGFSDGVRARVLAPARFFHQIGEYPFFQA